MSGNNPSTVPAKEVQMFEVQAAQPMSEPGSTTAKYDDRKDDKLKFFNRMIVCGVAVVLLWCTSLSISVLIVRNFISAPSYTDIYNTCEYAYEVTVDEKDAYDECTSRQLSQCSYDFAQAYGNEEVRVTTASNANSATLTTVATIQSTCTTAYTNTQKALDEWSADWSVNYTTTCTPDEIDEVKNMVGDVSALRSASYSLADDYATDSTNRVSRLSNYAVARASYDSSYVSNKTGSLYVDVDLMVDDVSVPKLAIINMSFVDMDAMVNELVACVSMDNSTKCKYGVGAADLYESLALTTNEWMQLATDNVLQLRISADDFENAVGAAYATMQDFYDAAQKTWNVLQQFEAAGSITTAMVNELDYKKWGPSFYKMSDFSAGSFNYPDDLIPASFLGAAAALFDPVKNAVDFAKINVSVGSLQTYKIGADWYNGLKVGVGEIDFTPSDYNPPEYSQMYPTENKTVEQEAADQDTDSTEFRSKTAVTLSAYDELSQTEDQGVDFKTLNLSKTDYTGYLSGYSFTFEPLSGTDYDVKIWVVKLGSIGSVLVIFDYIWRAFHTMRLIFTYWNKSALRLPVADIRKDKKKYQFATMGKRRMFLAVITSPIFFALLGVFFLAMLVAIISAAYVPLYNSYVAACVKHTKNDTFLTANLYSIAYNYASEDGNDNAYNGLEDYNVMYTDYCSTYGKATQTQQNDDEMYFSSISAVQSDNVENLALLDKCIDVDAMDWYFQQACCGMEGYSACTGYENPKYNGTCPINEATGLPYEPISNYLTIDECSRDLTAYSLQDGIFRCSALPICSLTCDGPDKELLDSVTKQCGCMVEWGFHAGFFQLTIAVIVYALINAARALFLKGLMILNWKKLTPNLFEYLANCRRNGKFVEPDYRIKDVPYSQVLREELDKKLKRFEFQGYMFVLIAVVINVPWIVFLSLASEDIEYQPDE